jgi:hypothetical protein
MSCKKLLSELSNLLDEDVDAGLRQQLDLHLRLCPDCYAVWDTTQKTLLVFRGSQPYELPSEVKSRLEQAVRRKLAERATSRA